MNIKKQQKSIAYVFDIVCEIKLRNNIKNVK